MNKKKEGFWASDFSKVDILDHVKDDNYENKRGDSYENTEFA